MQKTLLFSLFSFFFFLFSSSASAEVGLRYAHFTPLSCAWTDYLINSGRFTPRFALRQPFEMEPDTTQPVTRFSNRVYHHFYRDGQAVFYLDATERLKVDEHAFGRFNAAGGVVYTSDHITLVNRTEVNQDYKRDPRFAGDLSESEHWIYGRVEDAYINLNAGKFDLFFGRTARNWGPTGDYSLILSDHPYTYDHLLLSYTGGRLKLSVIYALLDKRDALKHNYPDSGYTPVPDARRHLVGHRLDFRVTDRLQFGLTEMAIYGGTDRPFEPAFMNPVNFYYPLQRNDRKLMSGYWAADLFFKPLDKWTFYGQFLIDDVVVNNDPGVDDRASFPDRFGLSASVRTADLLGKGSNINLGYTRIWNRSYQSRFTWENYHYRELGLGYPRASCEEVKLKLTFWQWFPLWFKNETIYGRYGSVQLTDIFPLKHEDFPVPPVRHNLYNRLDIHYEYSPSLRLFGSARYLHDPVHYLNRLGDQSTWTFDIGLRLLLSTMIPVDPP